MWWRLAYGLAPVRAGGRIVQLRFPPGPRHFRLPPRVVPRNFVKFGAAGSDGEWTLHLQRHDPFNENPERRGCLRNAQGSCQKKFTSLRL